MDFRHSLEMGVSREEFFRFLPSAVGSFQVDGDTIRPPGGSGGWLIRLTPLADHRAGSVAIPRHRIEITLERCREADAAAFMARFHRAFLRGGG